jgi:hypothetical protein
VPWPGTGPPGDGQPAECRVPARGPPSAARLHPARDIADVRMTAMVRRGGSRHISRWHCPDACSCRIARVMRRRMATGLVGRGGFWRAPGVLAAGPRRSRGIGPHGERGVVVPRLLTDDGEAHPGALWSWLKLRGADACGAKAGRRYQTRSGHLAERDNPSQVQPVIPPGRLSPQQHVRVMLDPHGHPFCLF